MAFKPTNVWGKGTCYEGEMNGYRVLAKVMDKPSAKGLGGGRILELHVGIYGTFSMRDSILTYMEEWFGPPPKEPMLRDVVEQVVRLIDKRQVDWQREQKQYESTFRD